MLEIEPNPAHSPVGGVVTPCWVVVIPQGCFSMNKGRFEVMNPQCGVQVLLRDEDTQFETDITPFVTDFEASIALDQAGGRTPQSG